MTVLSLLGKYLSSHEVHFHLFYKAFYSAWETCMVDFCKSLLTLTYYVSSTKEPNFLLSVYIVSCSATSHCQAFFDTHFTPCPLLILTLCPHMLISDIRSKSRGISLPNNQSAASRLAQHTDQHPGITTLTTVSTLSSLIVTTHVFSICLANFGKIT